MQTVQMSPTEFTVFKELANKVMEMFQYYIKRGVVYITASIEFLFSIGY